MNLVSKNNFGTGTIDKNPAQIASERSPSRKVLCVLRGSSSLTVYWIFAILRIILTLVPQKGYIHPDEFFQTSEVVIGDVLRVEANVPWEFNETYPIRNVILPYAIIGLPIWILNLFVKFFDGALSVYILITLPRLVCCLLSFVTDYCLYKICLLEGEEYQIRLITFASSHIAIIYATRTFTNTFEMALTSLLLYLVSWSIHNSRKIMEKENAINKEYSSAVDLKTKVALTRSKNRLPKHSFSCCFFIATITVIGIFNRPTFIGFAFPAIFFWLLRGITSKSVGMLHFHLRLFLLAVSSLPSLLIFIAADSIYFGALTAEDFAKNGLLLRQFIITPFNFIKYNSNSSNLSKHGIHPRFIHLFVNFPLLYSILGVMALLSLLNLIKSGMMKKWHHLPRTDSIFGLMMTSIFIPLCLLSIFPHQEPRFLLALTLPVIFLFSTNLQERRYVYLVDVKGNLKKLKNLIEKKSIRQYFKICWYVMNFGLIIFYGFFHQAGIYSLLSHLSTEIQLKPKLTHFHLVTSHIYSIPVSPLQIESSKILHQQPISSQRYLKIKDFYTYEIGSSHEASLILHLLDKVIIAAERKKKEKFIKYRVFLAIPSSILSDIEPLLQSHNFTLSILFSTFSHISTEAMPKFKAFSNYFSIVNLKQKFNLSSFLENFSENLSTIFSSEVQKFSSAFFDLYRQFGFVLIEISMTF